MTDRPTSPAELTDARIAEIRARAEAATAGPWWPGHLSDDTHPCNCRSVLSETCCGGVATVEVNNGLRVGPEGGNDAPPLAEAKANLLFIAHAREDVPALLSALLACRETIERMATDDFKAVAEKYTRIPIQELNNAYDAEKQARRTAEASLLACRENAGCCDGCGSTQSMESLRAEGNIACCPERKMLSAKEWRARAETAEASLLACRERADRLEETLTNIAAAKEPAGNNQQPDDIDWRFVALEMKRVALIAIDARALLTKGEPDGEAVPPYKLAEAFGVSIETAKDAIGNLGFLYRQLAMPEGARLTAGVPEGERDSATSLLQRASNEITNLQNKITRGEKEGWEGIERRIALKAAIERALAASPLPPGEGVARPVASKAYFEWFKHHPNADVPDAFLAGYLVAHRAAPSTPAGAAMEALRFDETSCSQCGGSFGPGDSGFSHCDQHEGLDNWDDMSPGVRKAMDKFVRALAERRARRRA